MPLAAPFTHTYTHTHRGLSDCLFSLLSSCVIFCLHCIHLSARLPQHSNASIPCYCRGYVSHTDMRVLETPLLSARILSTAHKLMIGIVLVKWQKFSFLRMGALRHPKESCLPSLHFGRISGLTLDLLPHS